LTVSLWYEVFGQKVALHPVVVPTVACASVLWPLRELIWVISRLISSACSCWTCVPAQLEGAVQRFKRWGWMVAIP